VFVLPRHFGIYLLLFFTAIIWGGTFAAGKLASFEAQPLSAALWRFILALIILAPQAFKEGLIKKFTLKTVILLVLSGLTGLVLYNYFFIKGLALTGAGRGAVIVTVNPVFIYLGAIIFFHERVTFLGIVGMFLAVLGTVCVVTSGKFFSIFTEEFNVGDILMVGCVFSWTIYSLLGKVLLVKISPIIANTWATVIAIVLLIPLCILVGEPLNAFVSYSFSTWLSLAFLGIFGSAMGFTFFYKGILILGPSRTAVFITLVPFFGILSGAVIHGEIVQAPEIIGLFISLAGLTIIQKN
jgi:drug/metabolite transporter (DMT)-like permease